MQDRFKFRFLFDNKIYDVVNICFLDNELFIKIDENLLPIRTRLDYKRLMQCTGLKDKNGKLIYEGDIIRTAKHNLCNKNQIFEIIWHKDYAQFLAKNVNLFCIDLTDAYLCEIIGNIYENPELLN